MSDFNGLGMSLGNLPRLSSAKTRSISAENFTGEKSRGGMATEGMGAVAARDLGRGWKVSPCISIEAGQTSTLAMIKGPGAIQHIWMTPNGHWRFQILRIYWDGSETPSVECPVGDFFASGWQQFHQISSLAICVNPHNGLNCYWEMPFRKDCRITLTNLDDKPMILYYQIDYTLTDVDEDAAYFHAQFRRVNPLSEKEAYTIVDGIAGRGQYVGTWMAWGSNNGGWWGEGEIKFFIDDGGEFPTICGTGTEDYFCGAYSFIVGAEKEQRYANFTTPYAGFYALRSDGIFKPPARFGLYRWHIMDPVRFEKNLRVTIQALGWRGDRRYLPLRDDLASVAFWYQTLPTVPFPKLPERDNLEII
jgi:hypothetical protein